MRQFKEKKLTKHGREIVVTGYSGEHRSGTSGVHFIHVEAKCGQTKVERRVPLGALEGPAVAPPTAEKLQQILDAARDDAANEAVFKETIREHFDSGSVD